MGAGGTTHAVTGAASPGAGAAKAKIRNVEILRFFLAWAVVGFHLVHNDAFDEYGFRFLKPYLICGEYAVRCFFVLAFYFLIRGGGTQQTVVSFVCRKWMRLAPLIIVVTLCGYILHCCGYWEWNWAANIEQWLLIHDWAGRSRWEQFVYPAWWCSAYLLVSVVYLVLVRAFPGRYIPLVLGILAMIAWRVEVSTPEQSMFMKVLSFGRSTVAFFYLGMGALIAYIVRFIEERSTLKSGSRLAAWGYTLAEVVLMGALLVRLFAARQIESLNPLLTTLCFSALLVLFILKRGYLSRLLENNFCSFLGRYAYAIFVVHCLVLSSAHSIILPHFKAEAADHPWLTLGCIAGVTMLLAMAGHHLVERPMRSHNCPKWDKSKPHLSQIN